MKDAVALAAKALLGGSLVVVFALLSQTMSPKRFAGLFSAAPAVAIAGMGVALVAKGRHEVRESALGMIAGCVGMAAYAVAVVPLLRRVPAFAASGLALGLWFVVAGAVAWPVL
jgi:uncharacterized membrane protein (GlpM family)